MMSETSARASRFARWSGSLERNGLTGRRAPLAGDATDGVAGGWAAAGRDVAGTNGGVDVTGAVPVGGVNGDTGTVPIGGVNGVTGAGGTAGAGRGVNGGTGGGDANSGSPVLGDGGVAVAVTGPLSGGRLGRGVAGTSAARGGCGAGAGRW